MIKRLIIALGLCAGVACADVFLDPAGTFINLVGSNPEYQTNGVGLSGLGGGGAVTQDLSNLSNDVSALQSDVSALTAQTATIEADLITASNSLQSQINGLPTGTPIYVESDPIASADITTLSNYVALTFATNTPLYEFTEADPIAVTGAIFLGGAQGAITGQTITIDVPGGGGGGGSLSSYQSVVRLSNVRYPVQTNDAIDLFRGTILDVLTPSNFFGYEAFLSSATGQNQQAYGFGYVEIPQGLTVITNIKAGFKSQRNTNESLILRFMADDQFLVVTGAVTATATHEVISFPTDGTFLTNNYEGQTITLRVDADFDSDKPLEPEVKGLWQLLEFQQ